MSSFYAGVMNGGGGGGGADYDKIVNAPIVNVGTETTTTILAGLSTGHYNLKGNYQATLGSEEITNTSSLDILVLEDTITKRRVIEFLTVENGEVYMNTFAYEEDGTLVKQDKISLTTPAPASWGDIG